MVAGTCQPDASASDPGFTPSCVTLRVTPRVRTSAASGVKWGREPPRRVGRGEVERQPGHPVSEPDLGASSTGGWCQGARLLPACPHRVQKVLPDRVAAAQSVLLVLGPLCHGAPAGSTWPFRPVWVQLSCGSLSTVRHSLVGDKVDMNGTLPCLPGVSASARGDVEKVCPQGRSNE